MIIVDTNVVSELMRSEPAPAVQSWALSTDQSEVHTTSVTIAEVLYGIERLPTGRRREGLHSAATAIFETFATRILAFDVAAAERYATVVSDRDRLGRPINGFDAQIAAIALRFGAALATRNTVDFEDIGVDLIDPWSFH